MRFAGSKNVMLLGKSTCTGGEKVGFPWEEEIGKVHMDGCIVAREVHTWEPGLLRRIKY